MMITSDFLKKMMPLFIIIIMITVHEFNHIFFLESTNDCFHSLSYQCNCNATTTCSYYLCLNYRSLEQLRVKSQPVAALILQTIWVRHLHRCTCGRALCPSSSLQQILYSPAEICPYSVSGEGQTGEGQFSWGPWEQEEQIHIKVMKALRDWCDSKHHMDIHGADTYWYKVWKRDLLFPLCDGVE